MLTQIWRFDLLRFELTIRYFFQNDIFVMKCLSLEQS